MGHRGGETGIRTLGRLAPTTVFETAPFDHSGTSPRGQGASTAVRGTSQGAIRSALTFASTVLDWTQGMPITTKYIA